MDLKFEVYTPDNKPSDEQRNHLIDFLHAHLEQYGDAREHIAKSVACGFKEGEDSLGGFILEGIYNDSTVGVVVINKTGMGGYIPDNILVYIAVDKSFRGLGFGKQLMNKVISLAEGDIALHVEKDNPATFLYEKVGFTNKYLEYRYHQEE